VSVSHWPDGRNEAAMLVGVQAWLADEKEAESVKAGSQFRPSGVVDGLSEIDAVHFGAQSGVERVQDDRH
jgi:hypothetical protein